MLMQSQMLKMGLTSGLSLLRWTMSTSLPKVGIQILHPRRISRADTLWVVEVTYLATSSQGSGAVIRPRSSRSPTELLSLLLGETGTPGIPGCAEITQVEVGSCLFALTYDSANEGFGPEKSLFSGAYMQGTTSATFLEVPDGSGAEDNLEVGIPYLVPTSGGGSKKGKKGKKGKKRKKAKKSESSDDYDDTYIIEDNVLCLDVKFLSRYLGPSDSTPFVGAYADLGTLCREFREPMEEGGLYLEKSRWKSQDLQYYTHYIYTIQHYIIHGIHSDKTFDF